MKATKNPAMGGMYYKPAPDANPILVSGTDRKPTEAEIKALAAAKQPKGLPTDGKNGDQK
jgi:hypothetical protein